MVTSQRSEQSTGQTLLYIWEKLLKKQNILKISFSLMCDICLFNRQVEYTGSKQGTAWIIAMATNPCCAGPILRGAIREKEVGKILYCLYFAYK